MERSIKHFQLVSKTSFPNCGTTVIEVSGRPVQAEMKRFFSEGRDNGEG